MNYRDQERFFRNSRILGGTLCLFLLTTATVGWRMSGSAGVSSALAFCLVTLALALSLYYSPDYLFLSVMPEKKARWQIKIRWRVIAAVLIAGTLAGRSEPGLKAVGLALCWLMATNLLARYAGSRGFLPGYFWAGDVALLALLSMKTFGLNTPFDFLMGGLLLAGAAHLAMVTCDRHNLRWAAAILLSGWLVVALAGDPRKEVSGARLAAGILLAVVVGATAWLALRAQRHNADNIEAALGELVAFTGFTVDRIRNLWATSNQDLAQNWQRAAIAQGDGERLAEWYRQNSELYLFAISGYNLEYKRIRSNIEVLRLARGACLDYGAGNGEILLELARRGHPATYFDVEGQTMRFARHRAARQELAVEFVNSKDGLAGTARQHGFDTVFSFDVLEHLPDLPGELDFLSSLLNPGGLFVFDVPAGSTKAHPMHLNHNLNVLAHFRHNRLEDKRGLWLRLPFRKEQKYVFTRPVQLNGNAVKLDSEAGGRRQTSHP